jgi:hypothetical protein
VSSYELAVVAEGLADAESGEGVVVLRRVLPQASSSWTPSADLCLAPGRYSWSIRALGGSDHTWSDPIFFEVETSLVDRASLLLDILQREREEAELKAVQDRRRQGSLAKQRSTLPAGAGVMPLVQVDGELSAGAFSGDGSAITGVLASDLACAGCVSGSKISASAITSSKIDNYSVTSAKVLDGTIGTADIASNSVTSASILDGVIGSQHIAAGAVRSAGVVNGAVGASELATIRAVGVECNGDCSDSDLGQVCDKAGAGWQPLAASSPHDVPNFTTSACGSGDNQCSALRDVNRSTLLSTVCVDGGGWDCLVLCMQ